MKYLLILFMVDKFDIPTESMAVTTVSDKYICESDLKNIISTTKFIRGICVPRQEGINHE